MSKLIAFLITTILAIVLIVGFSALGGWIFMHAFNFVAPIFWKAAPILTFYQAWGTMFIISLIANMFRSSK